MRGQQERSGALFSYVSIEERIPPTHPLQRIRRLADQALAELHGTFEVLYAREGRPSVPPEQLLLASMLQAWASHASLERIDGKEDAPPPASGPGEGFGAPKEGKKRAKGDFRGIKLSNDTHRSTTDPEAMLARKSNAHPAQLSYRGHVLMENRHDLVVDCRVTLADGFGERDAAKDMAAPHATRAGVVPVQWTGR